VAITTCPGDTLAEQPSATRRDLSNSSIADGGDFVFLLNPSVNQVPSVGVPGVFSKREYSVHD
jgi:hypothetical protein